MSAPRVFGIDYRFLACGDVFTQGLAHAADALGITYAHTDWADGDLAAHVTRFRPELVLVVHGRKFVRRWRRPTFAVPTAVWLLDEPYEVDDTASWSSRFDAVFVNDPASLPHHQRASYLPVCYDPVVHVDNPTIVRDLAVGFIGGGNPVREQYLGALADAGLLTYAIGGPWYHAGIQRICRSLNIPAAETPGWYRRTQIVLNIFRSQHHYNHRQIPATAMNPRIYEALACGALVVSEARPEIAEVFPELPTFASVPECVALVRSLLANPMQAEMIRVACAARVEPHTYAHRLSQVLARCGAAVPA